MKQTVRYRAGNYYYDVEPGGKKKLVWAEFTPQDPKLPTVICSFDCKLKRLGVSFAFLGTSGINRYAVSVSSYEKVIITRAIASLLKKTAADVHITFWPQVK